MGFHFVVTWNSASGQKENRKQVTNCADSSFLTPILLWFLLEFDGSFERCLIILPKIHAREIIDPPPIETAEVTTMGFGVRKVWA